MAILWTFAYLFNKYSLSNYYVLGTVLGVWESAVRKMNKAPVFMGLIDAGEVRKQ